MNGCGSIAFALSHMMECCLLNSDALNLYANAVDGAVALAASNLAYKCDNVIRNAHVSRNRGQQATVPRGH